MDLDMDPSFKTVLKSLSLHILSAAITISGVILTHCAWGGVFTLADYTHREDLIWTTDAIPGLQDREDPVGD